jgi:hypothetical protein
MIILIWTKTARILMAAVAITGKDRWYLARIANQSSKTMKNCQSTLIEFIMAQDYLKVTAENGDNQC